MALAEAEAEYYHHHVGRPAGKHVTRQSPTRIASSSMLGAVFCRLE